MLARARARTRDDVVVNVSVDYLPRTRNRAVREALLRYGLIAKVGPSRVDWTARARRSLAPCPYPDGTEPVILGCRRVVVARLRTIALTSYTYDYTGFETGQAERVFGYRFTAAASNAIGSELARRNGLMCARWIGGESVPPEVTWTQQTGCAGSLARISHPTLGDPEFVDLAFDGLEVPSGVGDFNPTTDRF